MRRRAEQVWRVARRPMRAGLSRLLHLEDSPRRIAASFALGAFIAFTPLWGIQIALALGLAMVLGLNKRAALLGTLVNLPWLAPIYYVSALALGGLLLGVDVTPSMWQGLESALVAIGSALIEFNGSLLRAAWDGLVHLPLLRQAALSLALGCTLLAVLIAASLYQVSSVVLVRQRRRAPVGPRRT